MEGERSVNGGHRKDMVQLETFEGDFAGKCCNPRCYTLSAP